MHLCKYLLLFTTLFFSFNYSIAETTSDAIAKSKESKYSKIPTFVTTQTKIKNRDTYCKSVQDKNDVLTERVTKLINLNLVCTNGRKQIDTRSTTKLLDSVNSPSSIPRVAQPNMDVTITEPIKLDQQQTVQPREVIVLAKDKHFVSEDDLRLGNDQRLVDPSDNLATAGTSLISSSTETCQNENSKLHEEIDQSRRMFEEMLKEQIETRMRKFFANEIFESCRSIDIVTKKKKKDTISTTTKPGHSFCLVYHMFQVELKKELDLLDLKHVNLIQRVLVAGQETKVRRNLVACPTFLFADDAALSGTDGYNVLTASCTMGSVTVANGKTLKIKKDPSVVGEIFLDRQATSANKGRHFLVHGIIVMEGITLKGGNEVSYISSNILLLII
jgi:hypothetical protein